MGVVVGSRPSLMAVAVTMVVAMSMVVIVVAAALMLLLFVRVLLATAMVQLVTVGNGERPVVLLASVVGRAGRGRRLGEPRDGRRGRQPRQPAGSVARPRGQGRPGEPRRRGRSRHPPPDGREGRARWHARLPVHRSGKRSSGHSGKMAWGFKEWGGFVAGA